MRSGGPPDPAIMSDIFIINSASLTFNLPPHPMHRTKQASPNIRVAEITQSSRPGNSAKRLWELEFFNKQFLQKEGIYWVKNAGYYADMFLMMGICSKKQSCYCILE